MDNTQKPRLDLDTVRAKLAAKTGPQYWNSLEELAETPGFLELLDDEFPQQMRPMSGGLDRRQFLTLAAAGLALAGLSGCRYQEQRRAVPYVNQPEGWIPGKPLFYASAYTQQGFANGILVRSNEGRPTKIEGNPDHPASIGAVDAITQASLLTMYDPDRSTNVVNEGDLSSWDTFIQAVRASLAQQKATQGAGLRILTETVSSAVLADQIKTLLAQYPNAKWVQWEPMSRDSVRAGATLAFGQNVHTQYHFDKAARVLSLDGDFLLTMPNHLRHARDFSDRRRVRRDTKEMNRLYVLESSPSITGAMADHKLPLRAGDIEDAAFAIAKALGVDVGTNANAGGSVVPGPWIGALVKDLQANRGASLVVVGDQQSPTVHALGHAINAALGSVGTTITYTDPVEASPGDETTALRELVADMQAGRVQTLAILGGNPVYNAPADLNFAEQLTKVPLRFHLSMHEDETSALCQWHVPETHYLEAWSDTRAFDGTTSVVQPLIAPLYDNARSVHELLEAMQNKARDGYTIVHDYYLQNYPQSDFEKWFQTALHDGMVPNTALPARTVALKPGLGASLTARPAVGASDLEIIFRPDPTIWDGRFANNGWLQELPKPLTKLTWDNTAQMSLATAQRLGVTQEDLAELTYQGRKVQAPVWIVPGHPDNAVTVHLGYGRTRAGHAGTDAGFNAYALRTADQPAFGNGLTVRGPVGRYNLAITQQIIKDESVNDAKVIEAVKDRHPVESATFAAFLQNPNFLQENAGEKETTPEPASREGQNKGGQGRHEPITLYGTRDHDYPKNPNDPDDSFGAYQWGMSIDNNVCIGCNACVMGCASENNTPVIGKDEVMRGRAMHWLRIDNYYVTSQAKPISNPETLFQPLMCVHCENAPCEPVCPVAATVHSHEGLNMMVYNRCVGTKYCSNNCPYKVRHFNFYKYIAGQPSPEKTGGGYDNPSLKLVVNPEVTLRGRGVMEKCTYCVHRISLARIEAKKEGREIRDGEVITACQQACPTNAIVFGNIRDQNAEVTQLKTEPHDYGLLAELGTRPRTTHLAKFRNPNPEIEAGVETREG